VRFDRKILLIAPTVVLALVVAGMIYAATQLHVLSSVSETYQERSDFIAAVERGEKPLDPRQALGIIHAQFDVETRRTAALVAARDLLVVLSVTGIAALGVLAAGVRRIPREHWPRLSFGRQKAS
jgi:hypothetical protein